MYALARNAGKYSDRDKRLYKAQHLEYHYLAPDSINELFDALILMEKETGRAALLKENAPQSANQKYCIQKGKTLLKKNDPAIDRLEIFAEGFENSSRPVQLIKVRQAYQIFQDLIACYCAMHVQKSLAVEKTGSVSKWIASQTFGKRKAWVNMGGQLVEASELEKLITKIEQGKIKNWKSVHQFYQQQAAVYATKTKIHALACLKELSGQSKIDAKTINALFKRYISTKEWMLKGIETSREKDYTNPFRRMVYANDEEMEVVTGKLSENTFILQQRNELKKIKKELKKWADLF